MSAATGNLVPGRAARRGGSERGSAVVEMAVLTPALVLMLLLVVAAGRVGQATNDVYGSSADAARAASLRDHPTSATHDARTTAERTLAARGVSCRQLAVSTDTSRLHPGGSVSVDLSCTVDLSDLGLLGLPSSRTVRAGAAEVIDTYRGS